MALAASSASDGASTKEHPEPPVSSAAASTSTSIRGSSSCTPPINSDSQPSESSSCDDHPRKKRKSTHRARKEEIGRLQEEALVLETQVMTLNRGRQQEPDLLTEAALMNSMLRHAHREQQLSLATAQSAISDHLVALSANPHNPLHSHIKLGKDPAQRRDTLLAMREPKLRDALVYIQSRAKFLDPLNPHHSLERFDNADGDFCGTRFDVYQFAGVKGAKQVLDTLMHYHQNVEISVSEQLGSITVREDYDNIDTCGGSGSGNASTSGGDGGISNFRLLTNERGFKSEVNLVTFMQYYESHELVGGAPCAVCLVDWVDDDELHPYNPRELVRKQISEAIVITEHRRKKPRVASGDNEGTADPNKCNGKEEDTGSSGKSECSKDGALEEDEEVVVAMMRCKFSKVCRPAFKMSRREEQLMRSGVCWGPVMVQTISDLLYPDLMCRSDPERFEGV